VNVLAVTAVVVMLLLKCGGGGITLHIFRSCNLDLKPMT